MFFFELHRKKDIDHFYKNLDFTYNNKTFENLPEYVNELKSQGIRFITILVEQLADWDFLDFDLVKI